jgi:hypothetical protein
MYNVICKKMLPINHFSVSDFKFQRNAITLVICKKMLPINHLSVSDFKFQRMLACNYFSIFIFKFSQNISQHHTRYHLVTIYEAGLHLLFQLSIMTLFVWMVAGCWCWFVLRENLLASGWWLVCSEGKILLAGGW